MIMFWECFFFSFNFAPNLDFGRSLELPLATSEKDKFCLRNVRCFSSGTPVFCPSSMNDRLNISEIFLKEP